MSGRIARMDPRIALRRRAVRSDKARSHRSAVLAGLALVAAGAGSYWVLTGPPVAIRHIEVTGYARPDGPAVAAYISRAASGANMLSLPEAEIRQELQRFAWIKDVHLERDWPSSVVVRIVQVKPAIVAIPVRGKIGLLAPDGRLLSGLADGQIPPALPRISVSRMPKLLGDRLPEVERGSVATIAALKRVGGLKISQVQVRDGGVTAILDSGFQVRLGPPDGLEAKVVALRTVLPRIAASERVAGHYVDVRVPKFTAVGKVRLTPVVVVTPAVAPTQSTTAGAPAPLIERGGGGPVGSTPVAPASTSLSPTPAQSSVAAIPLPSAPATVPTVPPPPPSAVGAISQASTPASDVAPPIPQE